MSTILRIAALALAFSLYVPGAFALSIDMPLPNEKQEARARALFDEIRCVVCEAESIADSPAEVARDMRRAIREEIADGESDAEIKSALVMRYGDSVLMQPPLNDNTWFLWFGPPIILLLGMLLALAYLLKTLRRKVV